MAQANKLGVDYYVALHSNAGMKGTIVFHHSGSPKGLRMAEAIFRVMGGDKVKIAEKLKAMSAKDKAALESNPRIKAAMDAIREEKGKGVAPIEDDALESMFK